MCVRRHAGAASSIAHVIRSFRASVRSGCRKGDPHEGADVTSGRGVELSASDHGEIQLGEPLRIRKHVDRDDPAAPDRQGQDREWECASRGR